MSWKYSSLYHHNTVGAVERANQSLMEKIRKLTEIMEMIHEKKR